MLKDFSPRLYQETILATAALNNTLVVLPTGLGKTAISMLLTSQRLTSYPNSKILILAPTRPLVEQHIETFKKHIDLDEKEFAIFTGMISPKKRAELWKEKKIIFSTPQGLENDIISDKIDLSDVSLFVFDEAHRAVGDYSYVFIAKQYQKLAKYPRILALTASPGSDNEKIDEVIKNLGIESIEIRSPKDPDVKPYIQDVDIKWEKVELTPPFKEIQNYLKEFLKNRLKKLKDSGILKSKNINFVSKTDLLKLQAQVRGEAMKIKDDYTLWGALSILAEIMKIQHGLELLESQGIFALTEYLEKIHKEGLASKTKAVKNIINDSLFRSALIKSENLKTNGIKHPKLTKLLEIIKQETNKNKNCKIMVFNQFRDNAQNICSEINTLKNCNAKLFVGQSKKKNTGMSQKQQKEMIDKFRNTDFNILVATSVAEEGLDIPKVDMVIFYEPIPSEIRTIQRRGRTGRLDKGRVTILMTKGTRDEAYKWSAHHKEKRMFRNLSSIKKDIILKDKTQKSLDNFSNKPNIKIIVDHREKNSSIVKNLKDLNIKTNIEKLESGDYMLSDRCGIEFKTKEDFVNSIVDGRILQQIKSLKTTYSKPLFIIQGEEDIYSLRNIHHNSINGMLATITISYAIPILFTKNSNETASIIQTIAKREQLKESSEFNPHSLKNTTSISAKQEYIISSFPGIGPGLAKELLESFGTIKEIINSEEEELKEIDKIGEKKAKELFDIFNKNYKTE